MTLPPMPTPPTSFESSEHSPEETGMSFRERNAWVCLLTTLLVWTPYFWNVLRLLDRNELTTEQLVGAFVGAIDIQIVLQIVAAILIAFRSKQEPKDERDLAIEAKAIKNAYFVLTFFCVFAVGWVIMYTIAAGTEAATRLLTPTVMSQMVL